eukprot:5995256-Ditylum_brightwellii.AAC.1
MVWKKSIVLASILCGTSVFSALGSTSVDCANLAKTDELYKLEDVVGSSTIDYSSAITLHNSASGTLCALSRVVATSSFDGKGLYHPVSRSYDGHDWER